MWTGTEDLKGYDKLTFQFFSDGRAVMMDKDGTTSGSYQASGASVTLRFHASVVYTGTISGDTMSGTATGAGSNPSTVWNWSVKYQPAP